MAKAKTVTVKGTKIDLKGQGASYGVKNRDGTITYTLKDSGAIPPTQPTTGGGTDAQARALAEQLAGVSGVAKSLGIDTKKADAMVAQTRTEGAKSFKGSSFDTGFEPTTISDANVRDKYIPEINAKINKYAETGQYYDSNGNLHNADGSIAEQKDSTQDDVYSTGSAEADSLYSSAANDSKLITDTLDRLMAQTDKDTASQIQAIKAQYEIRKQQLEEVNRREQLGESTGLLMGGSSRYAGSATGIMAGYQRADIMELADLDAKEMSAIAEAQAAQSERNYQIAAKKLDYVETLRKEKIQKAKEIADKIAEENKQFLKEQSKASIEGAIADLFRQGVTDSGDIQKFLNYYKDGTSTGANVDLKTIKDALAVVNPDADLKGTSPDYQTFKMMQKNGDIPKSWTLFDFKRAVTNASKSSSSDASDYTHSEKLKLEQKFGADWKTTTSRKEQLDYLQGEKKDEFEFTDSQIANGAANAGVSISEFMRVSPDQQNEYINGRLKDLAQDINGILATIDPSNEDDAKEAYSIIRDILTSQGFDPATYQGGRFLEGNENLLGDSFFSSWMSSQ